MSRNTYRFICPLLMLALLVLSAGCNRQDNECLSRIGRKIAVHAKNGAGTLGAKLEVPWTKKELSLQEKIQDRLRFENTLTEITFEVLVKDKEVELKGTVKDALQRQRAVELAETLAGVEKVVNSIKLLEDGEAAK